MARILNKTKKSVFIALSMALVGTTPSVVQANSLGSINSYKVLSAIAVTAATASGIYAVSHWYRTATHTNNTSKNVRSTQKSVSSIEYLDVTNNADVDAVMAVLEENQKDEKQLRLIREKVEASCTLVARIDNEIIGTVTFALGENLLGTDCWIWFVAIKKGYQSQGHGTTLMQQVMHELKNVKKIDSVGLSVDVDNDRAQALYAKNGLKKIALRSNKDGTTSEIRICNFTWQGFRNTIGFRLIGLVPGIRFCV